MKQGRWLGISIMAVAALGGCSSDTGSIGSGGSGEGGSASSTTTSEATGSTATATGATGSSSATTASSGSTTSSTATASSGSGQGGGAGQGGAPEGFPTVDECSAKCEVAQTGQCIQITGDCATCCDIFIDLALEKSCDDESAAYNTCTGSDAALVCNQDCTAEENALLNCFVGACLFDQSNPLCQQALNANCVQLN